MKIKMIALASLLSISTPTMADTGVFIGVVYDFGGKSNIGFSAKLVSNDEEDKVVGTLGLSYFPTSTAKLGADIGLGYTYKNGLVTGSYDLFNQKPQFGIGYMDTQD